MAKRITNVVCIALLVALFIFPSRYLTKVSDEIVELAEDTVDAVYCRDWDAGIQNMEDMNAQFQRDKEKLHMFLHHEMVEDIEASMRSALQLMHVQDHAQSLMELEHIISRARYLKNIEKFSMFTLL